MIGTTLLILRFFLAIALYGFVGFAIWTLWKELKSSTVEHEQEKFPNLSLTIISEGEEITRSFNKSTILIGRHPSNNCQVEHRSISSQHARISYHHTQWWIEDLQSTNGTYLNDQQVFEPIVVTAGDTIRCGAVDMVVQIEGN